MSGLQPNIPSNDDQITSKQLFVDAKNKAREHIDSFASSLVLQAKILAFREKAELVLVRHIDEASDAILARKQRDWLREFLKIIGGALIGAFVPGLITSLPANDILSTVVYIVLGFAGMAMVFIGLSI